METEVYVIDVLQSVISAMQVADPANIGQFLSINFQPGRNTQILDSLRRMDLDSLGGEKYPLIAVQMPISESTISPTNNVEITFPRIVIAYLTKTSTGSEYVIERYDSDGVFKTILRPCLREFIIRLAQSLFTNMGDPDMYDFVSRDSPSQQPIGEGLNDFVDTIEILNLKVTIFSTIKTC